MIEHIVLIKVKPEFEDKIDEICGALKGLKEKIPEIVEISAGRNFSKRQQGFQVGLRSLFKSEDDLNTYSSHPAHVSLVESLIAPAKEDVIALDYEF